MAGRIKFRGGTTAEHSVFTGSDREITVDRTKKTLVVHDGINAGGSPLATEESVNNVIQELENKVDINENITTQGNLFNGLDQLVKLDSSGKLPAIDGSQLTGVSSDSLVDSGVNAGIYKSVTVNSKGIITDGTNPTTLSGYSIADAYTKTEVDNSLALKVDGTEIASVNLFRADKYLAAQNVANMSYDGNGKLSKVQYNNSTDVNYEVLTYNVDGKLSNVAHYTTSTLRGNTVLSYSAGKLVSAIYTGV